MWVLCIKMTMKGYNQAGLASRRLLFGCVTQNKIYSSGLNGSSWGTYLTELSIIPSLVMHCGTNPVGSMQCHKRNDQAEVAEQIFNCVWWLDWGRNSLNRCVRNMPWQARHCPACFALNASPTGWWHHRNEGARPPASPVQRLEIIR